MLKVMDGRIQVKKITETQTSSGLFLPEKQKKTSLTLAEVLSVGESNTKFKKPNINVGDKVLVKYNNDSYLDCEFPYYENVLAVV